MEGEYILNYDTLKALGKGAFGFVRLAKRKVDDFMVRFFYHAVIVCSTLDSSQSSACPLQSYTKSTFLRSDKGLSHRPRGRGISGKA